MSAPQHTVLLARDCNKPRQSTRLRQVMRITRVRAQGRRGLSRGHSVSNIPSALVTICPAASVAGWARGCSHVPSHGQAAHHWAGARGRPACRGACLPSRRARQVSDARVSASPESLNGTATLCPCHQDGTTTPAPGPSRIFTARWRDQETALGRGTWAASLDAAGPAARKALRHSRWHAYGAVVPA
jgi:hypothetical protein